MDSFERFCWMCKISEIKEKRLVKFLICNVNFRKKMGLIVEFVFL